MLTGFYGAQGMLCRIDLATAFKRRHHAEGVGDASAAIAVCDLSILCCSASHFAVTVAPRFGSIIPLTRSSK